MIGTIALAVCDDATQHPPRIINLAAAPAPTAFNRDRPSSQNVTAVATPERRPGDESEAPIDKPAIRSLHLRVVVIKGAGRLSRDKVQARLQRLASRSPCPSSVAQEGAVELVLKLKPGGALGYVKLRKSGVDPEWARCVMRWARSWKLGKPRGGAAAYVTVSVAP